MLYDIPHYALQYYLSRLFPHEIQLWYIYLLVSTCDFSLNINFSFCLFLSVWLSFSNKDTVCNKGTTQELKPSPFCIPTCFWHSSNLFHISWPNLKCTHNRWSFRCHFCKGSWDLTVQASAEFDYNSLCISVRIRNACTNYAIEQSQGTTISWSFFWVRYLVVTGIIECCALVDINPDLLEVPSQFWPSLDRQGRITLGLIILPSGNGLIFIVPDEEDHRKFLWWYYLSMPWGSHEAGNVVKFWYYMPFFQILWIYLQLSAVYWTCLDLSTIYGIFMGFLMIFWSLFNEFFYCWELLT